MEKDTIEAFAWSETKWYAECAHCGAKNEVEADACMSGASHDQTCEVCRKRFSFRAST
jgi:hypothetical protein